MRHVAATCNTSEIWSEQGAVRWETLGTRLATCLPAFETLHLFSKTVTIYSPGFVERFLSLEKKAGHDKENNIRPPYQFKKEATNWFQSDLSPRILIGYALLIILFNNNITKVIH